MLNGNLLISDREHRYFFALTLFGFVIRLIELLLALIFPEPRPPGVSFAIYSIFDHWHLMSPLYSFAALLVCLLLYWKLEVPLLATAMLPLLLLTFFYDYWFVDSQLLIRRAADVNPDFEFKTFDYILVSGSFYDAVTLILVNILFIWHTSLLIRLMRTSR